MLKHYFFFTLLLLQSFIYGTTPDYDVVVVGTSPISILEALYHSHCGEKVLMLEEEATCGGAWRTIDICGISGVDLGCHLIGNDEMVGQFLEKYVGCDLRSLENPQLSYDPRHASPTLGFYPSRGCCEMMENLLKLLHQSSVVLLLNTKLESVYIDLGREHVVFKTSYGKQTTAKIILTPNTCFVIENAPSFAKELKPKETNSHHLYLLIDDPTPWRFTYKCSAFSGYTRLMNLTPFLDLENQGLQLIALQTLMAPKPFQDEECLENLKKHELIDPSARLICSESFTYTQHVKRPSPIHHLSKEMKAFFEVLETGHLLNIGKYAPKWKEALKPFKEVVLGPAAEFNSSLISREILSR